ncbi:BnaA06g15960D [Brassica napus]|uniref:BnaA06g15960D protein n=1 Tax=Brassica napus TaxID=3708 RepID=A0A078F0Z0_BRANA|nr:BnaA06g15960D [Brassica napus]
MKFSLKREPESRSTDDYWRFWDTVYWRWREPVPVIKMQKKMPTCLDNSLFLRLVITYLLEVIRRVIK